MSTTVHTQELLLNPLAEMYRQAGWPMPRIAAISPDDIPQPYRKLLVHQHDMTNTLAEFCGQKIGLRVLARRQTPEVFNRLVVLVGERDQNPVELGAIRIELSRFKDSARRDILESRIPLGSILQAHKIAFTCRPEPYFRVQSDEVIGAGLGLSQPAWLFGRCNTLTDLSGHTLAEVVEILPLTIKGDSN